MALVIAFCRISESNPVILKRTNLENPGDFRGKTGNYRLSYPSHMKNGKSSAKEDNRVYAVNVSNSFMEQKEGTDQKSACSNQAACAFLFFDRIC